MIWFICYAQATNPSSAVFHFIFLTSTVNLPLKQSKTQRATNIIVLLHEIFKKCFNNSFEKLKYYKTKGIHMHVWTVQNKKLRLTVLWLTTVKNTIFFFKKQNITFLCLIYSIKDVIWWVFALSLAELVKTHLVEEFHGQHAGKFLIFFVLIHFIIID